MLIGRNAASRSAKTQQGIVFDVFDGKNRAAGLYPVGIPVQQFPVLLRNLRSFWNLFRWVSWLLAIRMKVISRSVEPSESRACFIQNSVRPPLHLGWIRLLPRPRAVADAMRVNVGREDGKSTRLNSS